ncbi:transferrin receptor protein 1-like [Myxocyprinus asiaticus]|uniref:transferrin receptor protein 1-like n=1 Tax=Myxocyprinus asiaticus TaxID=70543 RepID=UPI002221BED3|nr:transferrin receptor protein 1-like [Myxocyprinus asiaticus]XP_051543277.1 transferrin receptor protein 1-like [Myxocyprinus asiaticus]
MAGTIDQAKMKFSRIVNSRSYTRFNQSQNPDGESSRVEVKLSADGEEEMDGVEQGQVQHETYTRPSRPVPLNKGKIICSVIVVLLFFCLGTLIGYAAHRKSEPPSPDSLDEEKNSEVQPSYDVPAPTMDWSDIVKMMNEKLLSNAIQDKLSEYSKGDRQAGSSGDNLLADKIHDTFKKLNMEPWVDEHYVKLQYPSSSNPNKVLFGSEEIGNPKGFLAYSATGRKTGRVVYANYGLPEDLRDVKDSGVNLTGSVILLRAGKISMAQKVANAAEKGAVAALIYPDPADYETLPSDTELYGHVHLGSGDPYTPGFPSFNHTQFPPAKSSGLPNILAQTITANMASKILEKMGGSDARSSFMGRFSNYKLGNETDMVTVEVNNNLIDTKIHNVFGVIKGFVDADKYVVIGAQRDSLSSGYAKSLVGTTLLMELARVFTEMKKDGFKPRRSIVFASWSAGDFGNVGVTEWLEGYWASLDKKAFTYISLDGVVTGVGSFRASASPLLHTLLQKTMEKVKNPIGSGPVNFRQSLFQSYGGNLRSLLRPMMMDDSAYPFLALSGIPSVSFNFVPAGASADYEYFGTVLDNKESLGTVTGQKVGEMSVAAAQVAGQIALRLVHDHILKLDVAKYAETISDHVKTIMNRVEELRSAKVDKSESLSTVWLNRAKSSFGRAANTLDVYISRSDLEDLEMCRIINNRIMKVEHNFLSPYVSIRDAPFRHIFFGDGWQTTTDLENYLKNVAQKKATFDMNQVLNKFALLTWSIQGCANDLAGDIWSMDNEI